MVEGAVEESDSAVMIVKDTKCRSVVCKMSPGILGIPAQKPDHQVTDGTKSKSGSGNANASPFV